MIQTSPIMTPTSANRPQGGRPSADESGHERVEAGEANVFSTLLGLARVLGGLERDLGAVELAADPADN